MRKISNNFFSNDFIITGIYFTMLLIGFLSIYSSQNTDGYGFLSFQNESFKQLIWIFICLFVFFAISILEYRFIFDLAVPLYGLSLFLLVLVLFIGQEVNSHSSWFNLFGLKFQPSEFSKFSTALFLAKIFDSYSINLRNIKHIILTSLVFLLPSSIILLQGDTGTALVYFSFFLVFLREGLSLNFLIFSIAFVLIFIFKASVPVLVPAVDSAFLADVPYSTPATSSGSSNSFLEGSVDSLTRSGCLGCIGAGVDIGVGADLPNIHMLFF